MRLVWWAPLALVSLLAGGFGACQSFSAEKVVEPTEGGVGEGGAAQDGAVPDAGIADSAPPDGDASDGAVAFQCSPDAGCADSGCALRCPVFGALVGDLFRFEGKDGANLRVRGLTDCHLYACGVLVDPSDGYDCANPTVGRIGRACSGGGCNTYPIGDAVTVGMSNMDNCGLEQCTYSCTRIE